MRSIICLAKSFYYFTPKINYFIDRKAAAREVGGWELVTVGNNFAFSLINPAGAEGDDQVLG